jgi:hypothetical protein
MKKLISIFMFLILISCNGLHFKKVESRSLGRYKYPEVNKQALFELLKLYEESDKKKDNYEVYYKQLYGWNWHPKSGYLFYAQDLCGWGWVYSDVTLSKLKEEVENRNNYVDNEKILNEYEKSFRHITDNKEYALAKKNYFCTNICGSGNDKF